jgi:cobalt-zinc-cadmium efflux system protein
MHDHANHNHQHAPVTKISRAFTVGIVLNLVFVIIEGIAGMYYHSTALVADAGHNLSDVVSLVLAMLAFRLTKVKTNQKYTYGYKKTTVVAALFNALLLLLVIVSIGWEATVRLLHPLQTQGDTVAIVAGIGIIINAATAFLFFKDRGKDLNIKGAYLHLMADAAISAGVVITGIIMLFTHWSWLDSAISYLLMIVIFISTWKLLKQSVRLSLDGVPDDIKLQEIKEVVLKMDGIKNIHHIHIWAISTSENALTAHLVVHKNIPNEELQKIKHNIRHTLAHLNIQHITLETETEEENCEEENC